MSNLQVPLSCEQFEKVVSDYIDGALTASDRATVDGHAAQCASCLALLADVRAIVGNAAVLPSLSPSHDLWAGIARRLDTPVVSIGSTSAVSVTRARTVSFRMFAAAAAVLVAVSSGVTYIVTRGSSASTSAPTAVAAVSAPTTTPTIVAATEQSDANPNAKSALTQDNETASVPTGPASLTTGSEPGLRSAARYTSRVESSTNFAYEREIMAMRRIVDERLSDLDSVTVVQIERNLRIIDNAINDSRRALQNDPRSRFLSKQLDRALESKLDIMRRIALL